MTTHSSTTSSFGFGRLLRALLMAVLFGGAGWFFFDTARINNVKISGGPAQARAEAERLLRQQQGNSILLANIADLQKRLATLPGVESATVRRQLPSSLSVELLGRRALAAWDGGGLVDSSGRRYDGIAGEWLPIFRGNIQRAASMADFYGDADDLLRPLGVVIAQLQVSDDGEWRVFLQNGAVLYLGREDRLTRLHRYARHAQELHKKFTQLQAVDLRYKKGFSILPFIDAKEEA